jgi:hypothetical protein
MNSIIDIAESLINGIKDNPEFGNIKFLKAYGISDYDPCHGCVTAAVNIEEIERTKGYLARLYDAQTYGDVFSAKLTIRVYAPDDTSGESLSETSLKIRQAVTEADSCGFINESKISAIKYENDTGAVFREVTFLIEYVLCEAAV